MTCVRYAVFSLENTDCIFWQFAIKSFFSLSLFPTVTVEGQGWVMLAFYYEEVQSQGMWEKSSKGPMIKTKESTLHNQNALKAPVAS